MIDEADVSPDVVVSIPDALIKSQIDLVGAKDCRGKLTLLLAGLSVGDSIGSEKHPLP